jgi:hypothetical protein
MNEAGVVSLTNRNGILYSIAGRSYTVKKMKRVGATGEGLNAEEKLQIPAGTIYVDAYIPWRMTCRNSECQGVSYLKEHDDGILADYTVNKG